MDLIMEIARKHNLYVIEDTAQAHFAEYKGKLAGTMGDVGTFSFYPGKNLGAYGDAGAIITNDDDFAEKCRMYVNHGALKKHHHEMEGINSRMDGIQAAILSVKLKYIKDWNQKRLEKALFYNRLLEDIPQIKTPKIKESSKHIFHVYAILAENRDELKKHLEEKGVGTQIHYPTMLPFMPAYSYLNHKFSDFSKAFSFQNKLLSLPLYPEITTKEIEFIAVCIKEFYQNN